MNDRTGPGRFDASGGAPSLDGADGASGAGADGASGAGAVPQWSLRDRPAADTGGLEAQEAYAYGESDNLFQDVKSRVHRKLLQRLNLANLSEREEEEAVVEVRKVVRSLLDMEDTPLNLEEREALVEQVVYEVFGLGPLEPLVRDPEVSDILVNTYDQVYVERNGKLEPTSVRFRDDQHLMQVIDRIVSAVGRRIDDSSPMVDARLADGSRVNAVIPPLAVQLDCSSQV